MNWSLASVKKRDAPFYDELKREFFADREPYASTVLGLLKAARCRYHKHVWIRAKYADCDAQLIERIVTHYGGPTVDEACTARIKGDLAAVYIDIVLHRTHRGPKSPLNE